MSEMGLKMMGKDPSGNAKGVEVNGEGALKTLTTGNAIKEVMRSTSDELLTSNNIFLMTSLVSSVAGMTNLGVSQYKNISVFIWNKHDKIINVYLEKKATQYSGGPGKKVNDTPVIIDPGSTFCFDVENYPYLNTPAPWLYGRIDHVGRPTLGEVEVFVFGEVR